MTEDDVQLLDAHLDDALSAIDAEHLRVRLAAESELAAALIRLRGERAARLAAWRAMEPSERVSDTLVRTAVARARGAERRRRVARAFAAVAAAAACFAAGWLVRAGNGPAGVASVPPAADPVRTTRSAVPGTFRVALTDDAGNVLAVQTFSKPDEAQRFAADLVAWQAQQQQQPTRQGQMVLISDEF